MPSAIYPNIHDEKKLLGFRARYQWVREFARNKTVLDLGCGSGYGTSFYADIAKEVIGVDYDKTHIDFATSIFGNKKVRFYQCDATKKLPKNLINRFDIVVMFEVLEHFHWEQGTTVVYNAFDALKSGGLLLGTTPRMLVKTEYYPQKKQGDHCVLYHKRDVLHHLWRFNDIKFNDELVDWAICWSCVKP